MNGRSFAVISMVLLMLGTGFFRIVPADDAPVKDEGSFPKDFLGGGDYVMAKTPGGDSWIAVVFGSPGQSLRSPITVVASWTRTLAGAEIHDASGKFLNQSKPVLVKSLMFHRFNALLEFNDSNGDGIGDLVRSGQPVAPDQIIAREPVYKAVSLRQAWTRSQVNESSATENGTLVKTFGFSLSAADLDYIVIGNKSAVNASPGDGKLNRLVLTFHLKVFVTKATVNVPFFNITVDSVNGTGINTSRLSDRTYNVTTISARAKSDHLIEGWDFDPSNANPRLLLETQTVLGWAAAPAAAAWMTEALVQKTLDSGGRISYTPEGGGGVTADSSSDDLRPQDAPAEAQEAPKKAAVREIELSDNWEKCGWFTWTSDASTWSNATAMAQAGQVFFQVQGARRFGAATDRGAFSGVLLMGGLSYPPGWRISHDPETGVDMGNVDIPEYGPPPNHPPDARIAGPRAGQSFNSGDNVRLDGSASSDTDGDNLAFTWSEGSWSETGSAIVLQKFSDGKHNVTLTVHDGHGGIDNATVSFTVKAKKTPGFGPEAAASMAAVLVLIGRKRRLA